MSPEEEIAHLKWTLQRCLTQPRSFWEDHVRFLLFGTPEPVEDPDDARGDDEYFGREHAMGDS